MKARTTRGWLEIAERLTPNIKAETANIKLKLISFGHSKTGLEWRASKAWDKVTNVKNWPQESEFFFVEKVNCYVETQTTTS